MAPPKKHKSRPANAKARKKAGWKPQVTFTLSEDTLLHLDAISAHYDLGSRSAAVRFLAKREADKIIEKVTKHLK